MARVSVWIAVFSLAAGAVLPASPANPAVQPVCLNNWPCQAQRTPVACCAFESSNESIAASGEDLAASLPAAVLSPQQRKEADPTGMVEANIRRRVLEVLEEEKREWDQVGTLADWERFRAPRLAALAISLGDFPRRVALQTRVTKEFRGDGYRRQDLVYQSRPGLWVTANLYLPGQSESHVPAIVIIHSHHASKTQFELQDMGILWARSGCAVLVMDQLGYGERFENYPWDCEGHNSRSIIGMQLALVGENLISWVVWDVMRGVDLLFERSDIDRNRIVLLGAVAGGGDPAAVAAVMDPRLAAVVPFNFGEAEPEEARSLPEKNQWPLELADPGWGDLESTGALPGSIARQCLPWFICASMAPRRFVYAFELGWNVEDLPAWPRYQKVFRLYGVEDHLADAHGFGPFPGPGECWNIGPAQRRSLYPTLERWFGIPIPFADAESSTYANLAKRPGINRRPESELTVLTPLVAAEIRMRPVHELLQEQGEAKLFSARAERRELPPEKRVQQLRSRLAGKLGDIEPDRAPEAVVRWTKAIPRATAEGITITLGRGILVPLLLLRPPAAARAQVPVLVGISHGGKELFLKERGAQIENALERGMAVCLPDVRGTGETSPEPATDPDGDDIRQHVAGMEVMLGGTVLGKRVKDFRTVLAYLRTRPEIDSQRIGLWGDSFAPPNLEHLWTEELPQWQIGPGIEHEAEPLGGLLALIAALYEPGVRAVVVRRGLAGYLSLLSDPFLYVPSDIVVPGILEVGDIADIASAVAPTPMFLEGLVDGRNRVLPESALRAQLALVFDAYRESPASLVVRESSTGREFSQWFLAHL